MTASPNTPEQCCRGGGVPGYCIGRCMGKNSGQDLLEKNLSECSKYDAIVKRCWKYSDVEKGELVFKLFESEKLNYLV